MKVDPDRVDFVWTQQGAFGFHHQGSLEFLLGELLLGGFHGRRPDPKYDRRTIPMDWRHRAVCLDEDPELFFPIGNTGPALLQIEEAKAVCRRCPVTEVCLQWALESGQDAGVWGGLSEEERRSLKRRNARARRAV